MGKACDSFTKKPLIKSTNNNKPLNYKGKQNKEKPYRNNGGNDVETLSYNSMIGGLISTTKEITWHAPWIQSVSDAIMPDIDSPDSPNDEILSGEFVEEVKDEIDCQHLVLEEMNCEGIGSEPIPSIHNAGEPLLDQENGEHLLDLKSEEELISDLKIEKEKLQEYQCNNNSSMKNMKQLKSCQLEAFLKLLDQELLIIVVVMIQLMIL